MSPSMRRAVWYVVGVGLLLAALTATGVGTMVTKRPVGGTTDAANRGFFPQPGPLPRLADLHENLAALTVLLIAVGGAWLMVRVKQDWLGWLGVAFACAIVAGVTGLLLQYEAVQIAGRFDPDLRGSGFVFDGDFEAALYGDRLIGANWYRFWLGVHLAAACVTLGAVVRGVRDIDRHDDDIWADGRRRGRFGATVEPGSTR